MILRPSTVVWFLLVIAVGYTMFQVKYHVMQQEETLAHLNKQITKGRAQLRILDAEWSYLTRPTRLQRLATRYLDLAPMSVAHIVDLNAVPERPGQPPALVAASNTPLPPPATATQALGTRIASVDASIPP